MQLLNCSIKSPRIKSTGVTTLLILGDHNYGARMKVPGLDDLYEHQRGFFGVTPIRTSNAVALKYNYCYKKHARHGN